MSWDRSDRASRLPADWKTRREAVRKRAAGQCEWFDHNGRCPLAGAECDHVLRGDDHSLDNLQWLCGPHHRIKTQAEANAARPREKRRPGRHPGLA